MKGLLIAVGCLALFGCDHKGVSQERTSNADQPGGGRTKSVGETTLTGAQVNAVSNDAAIDKIVSARCDREIACNNIGADKRYGDRSACTQELKGKVQTDLKSNDCANGLDGKQLDQCLDQVRTENCNDPFDTIARLAACRSAELCIKTSTSPDRTH